MTKKLHEFKCRVTRSKPNIAENTSVEIGEGADSLDTTDVITPTTTTSVVPAASVSTNPFSSLALSNPPPPVRTTMKEQEMIDLLSITLSTTTISPNSTLTSLSPCNQNMHQLPMSPTTNRHPYGSHPFVENQVSYGNCIAPWVQAQFHPQPQTQTQLPNYSCACPPPPWAATAQVNGGQIALAMTTPYTSLAHHINASSAPYMPMQHYAVVPATGNPGSAMRGEEQAMVVVRNRNPAVGQKALIPSNRMFEDLDVFGNADKKLHVINNTGPSLSGVSNQAAV